MTLDAVLLREIDSERNLIRLLKSLPDLDDLSKDQIRLRYLEEMENG